MVRIFFKLYYTHTIDTPLTQVLNNPGIETDPIMVNGKRIGFQAKYFENSIDYNSIENSLSKAFDYYKGLLDLIVVYSNKNIDLNVKSLNAIIKRLKENGIEVKAFCNKNILDLINTDKRFFPLRDAFFNCENLDEEWFNERLNKSISFLGPRFIKDFNVEIDDLEQIFDLFYNNKNGENHILQEIERVVKEIENYCYVSETIKRLRETILNEYKKIKTDINSAFELYDKVTCFLNEINNNIIEKRDRSEDYSSFVKTKYLIESLDFKNNNFCHYKSKVLIIEGSAGMGKSHLLAHEAEIHSDRNNILLLGHTLVDDSNPDEQIKSFLDINCSFVDLLKQINITNASTNSISVVFIDAVNEFFSRKKWKQYLKNLLFTILHLPFIKIVFSVRSTYYDDIFDDDFMSILDNSICKKVILHGFISNPLFACKQFFQYYKLDLDPLLVLNQDFSNPLFLKIYCESLSKGARPSNNDIFDVYEQFVLIEEKKFKEKQFIEDSRVFSDIVFNIFSDYFLKNKKSSIEKNVLIEKLKEECIDASYVNCLIKSAILFSFLFDNKEYVSFSYELFFEYNVAKQIMQLCDSFENLSIYCNNNLLAKDCGYLISHNACGIFSIIGILAKRKYSEEIIKAIDFSGWNQYAYSNVIDTYFSLYSRRNNKDIDSSFVCGYANDGIISSAQMFDISLELFFRKCELNNEYLNNKLLEMSLPVRDYYWTFYINESYINGGFIYRFVSLLYEDDLDIKEKKSEVALLTTWLLTSNNNEIRDKATKLLTKLLVNEPNICSFLLDNFHNVNDAYVLERLCGSVYGATINSVINKNYEAVGERIFNYFFRDNIYNDILVRDYCSNTIDYLQLNNIVFDFKVAKCFAPYPKQEIPNIPLDILKELYPISADKNDIEKRYGTSEIKRSMNPEYGINGFSDSFYGDFGRYVFGSHLHHFKDADSDLIFKYALHYIINALGYSNELFGAYDKNLRFYSRSTPLVERIGKKYEWIAMYHTLSLVMDKYKYEEPFSEASYTICKGAWMVNCRDLDFSLIRFLNKNTNFPQLKRIPYSNWNQDSEIWCSTKDLPPFVEDLSFDNKWLALYYSINDKHEDFLSPKQSVWRSVRGVLVKNGSYESLLKAIKHKKLLHLFNECPSSGSYNLMLREYGWSKPYFDEYQNYGEVDVEIISDEKEIAYTDDISFSNGKIIIKKVKKEIPIKKQIGVIIPAYSIYSWERYKDTTLGENAHAITPSRLLIEKLSLVQQNSYIWNNGEVDVIYDLSNLGDCNCDGLYIKKDYFISFLKENDYKVVWLCFGNKLDYSGEYGGTRIDKQSIVYFDNDYKLIEETIEEE